MIDKIIYKIEHKIKLNDKECEKIIEYYSIKDVVKQSDSFGRLISSVLYIENKLYILTWFEDCIFPVNCRENHYEQPIEVREFKNITYLDETDQLILTITEEEQKTIEGFYCKGY